MNLAGIYHRPESEMAYLYSKDVMHIRLKTAKGDISQADLLHGDPYSLSSRPDLPKFYTQPMPMKKLYSDGVYDYWQAAVTEPQKRLAYAFEVTDQNGSRIIYSDQGFIQPTDQRKLNDANTYFRMPYFQDIDAFHAPKWVEQTVWYQIFQSALPMVIQPTTLKIPNLGIPTSIQDDKTFMVVICKVLSIIWIILNS